MGIVSKELAALFTDIYVISLLIAFFCYLAIGSKAMAKIALCLLAIQVASRYAMEPLLKLEEARIIWYFIWMTVPMAILFYIYKLTINNPQIQKITIPVSILLLIDVSLHVVRHFDRNVFETDTLGFLYGSGVNAINYAIAAYLFAPIALLLVKSVRKRLNLNSN